MDKPFEPECSFSERATQLTSSAIREILKVTERPDIISFAGGLPAPSGFPVDVVRAAFDKVLVSNGRAALQYGPTEGYAPLRSWVANDLNSKGANVAPENILIVSGSQQALDLLGKVLIDKDSKVLVETPSYLGALQSFSLYQPRFVSVDSDEGGLVPQALTEENTKGARFLYALPNFQNPTGRTLSRQRRQDLIARAAALGLPVVEDDPYGELRYAGEPEPSLLALGGEANALVIRMGSFSKVLAPGLRLGYIAAPRKLIDKLVQAKQATDLHTATLTQMAVYEIVKDGFLDSHLPTVRELYRQQCNYMLDALQKEFPSSATWTRPEGGMFIWVTLPEGIDTQVLLQQAIEEKVAFVPGEPFYANAPAPRNTLRLSFVTVPEDKIRTGVATLGRLIKAQLA
ncbi:MULTISPECIES: PLP-dependent aminotransferase family protein [unclassified Achromobacter]|jgi:2-aminoadipate transaminase|uniref:aminotransferase-like domain-containing protein n=1 Tax=unclassified Achromobacter TaxID=2626865 RepID=UPI000B51E0C0|nr:MULTISPECIES: PLP-dependent aminotransferase family protein [unclassified Achromobacter]OWT74986.1 2-aminoadipate aminotransferase [Achromobacter sp. HZ28]OWT76594.1 2-aminoadipate aminotransferase [Achromobacter sp. HZ34]